MNRWLMPQELPVVACRLLKESAEVPLHELTQAAKEVSSKALGSRWSSREDCPSTLPAGANLQAAYPAGSHVSIPSGQYGRRALRVSRDTPMEYHAPD